MILIITVVSIILCMHCKNIGYNKGYSDGYEECKKNFEKIERYKRSMSSKFLEKFKY